jgi:hypothetical protein
VPGRSRGATALQAHPSGRPYFRGRCRPLPGSVSGGCRTGRKKAIGFSGRVASVRLKAERDRGRWGEKMGVGWKNVGTFEAKVDKTPKSRPRGEDEAMGGGEQRRVIDGILGADDASQSPPVRLSSARRTRQRFKRSIYPFSERSERHLFPRSMVRRRRQSRIVEGFGGPLDMIWTPLDRMGSATPYPLRQR